MLRLHDSCKRDLRAGVVDHAIGLEKRCVKDDLILEIDRSVFQLGETESLKVFVYGTGVDNDRCITIYKRVKEIGIRTVILGWSSTLSTNLVYPFFGRA